MRIELKDLGTVIQNYIINLNKELNDSLITNLQDIIPTNIKTVTGSVFADINRLPISSGVFRQPILRFRTKGEAALLLEDRSQIERFGYPRYVSFDEEPNLEQWVLLAPVTEGTKQRWLSRGGLVVGGENTRFGTNKWFTRSIFEVSRNINTLFIDSVGRTNTKFN